MSVYEKFLAVQAELKAPKGQYNSFGKYKYRSCEDICEAVKPVLAKHKAALFMSDDVVQIGERFYMRATATFVDVETGEKITNTAYAREEQDKKGMDGSQISGTASSYSRKYCLAGLFLLDDTKDADTEEYTAKTQGKKSSGITCQACGKGVEDITKRNGEIWAASDIAEYTKAKYGRCLCGSCAAKLAKEDK